MGKTSGRPLPDERFRAKGLFTNAKRDGVDRLLDREQVLSVLEAMKKDPSIYGQRAYPFFTILGNFGIRVSEAADLNAKDFAPLDREHFFDVRRKKKRGDSNMNFVWVNEAEAKLLKRLMAHLPQRGRLFPYSVRYYQHLFGFYCERAGLRNIYSPHALRRFVSSDMRDAGVVDWVISYRLGHSMSVEMRYRARPMWRYVGPELEKRSIVE